MQLHKVTEYDLIVIIKKETILCIREVIDPMGADPLYEECRQVANKLLRRFDWSLLTETELTDKLLERVRLEQVIGVGKLPDLALNIYSATLYDACTSDGFKREQGFKEVANYLFRAISNHYPKEIGETIVFDALVRIWQGIDTCQSPGTFIRFCLYRLQNATTAYLREQARLDKAETLPEENTEDLDEASQVPSALIQAENLPEIAIDECQKLRVKIYDEFAKLYQKYPKAKGQLAVVFQHYLMDLSVKEVAEKLGTTSKRIHELLSLGRGRVGGDLEFVHLLRRFRENCKD